MLMEIFDATFNITSVVFSIFKYSLDIEIANLPPNEIFEVRDFGPDGEALSGHIGLKSDINGKLVTGFGHTWSKPMRKGKYFVGIMKGEFNHNKKLWFEEWNKSPNAKNYTTFYINYSKKPLLSINAFPKIPWGTPMNLCGQLWYKDQEFPWCSGTTDMQGRKITFTGSDVNEAYTLTDAYSKYSKQIDVGNNAKSNCFVQAHYEGDPVYFEKCDSEIISYQIIEHGSSLSLGVEPLVPKLADLLDNGTTKAILKAGRFYLLKGRLTDVTIESSIPDRIIKFVGPVEFHLSSVVTDQEGCYTLCFKVPNSHGTFSIDATFEGDEDYHGSTGKISFEIAPDLSSQIPVFTQFKAFDSFKNGFEDLRENPQIRSSLWLLSLLDANPIALGIFDRNGEQITKDGNRLNHSGDIIARFEDAPLIIDCTVSVPDTRKIDKIFNTAAYFTKSIEKRYLAVIISNQSAKAMKQEASKNHVLLLDHDDILDIMDLVLNNQISRAKELFLEKLKQII